VLPILLFYPLRDVVPTVLGTRMKTVVVRLLSSSSPTHLSSPLAPLYPPAGKHPSAEPNHREVEL
jgi:hypothetical protein